MKPSGVVKLTQSLCLFFIVVLSEAKDLSERPTILLLA